jgi:hypothetical protein
MLFFLCFNLFTVSLTYILPLSLSRSCGVLNVKKYLNLTEANNKKKIEASEREKKKRTQRKEKR